MQAKTLYYLALSLGLHLLFLIPLLVWHKEEPPQPAAEAIEVEIMESVPEMVRELPPPPQVAKHQKSRKKPTLKPPRRERQQIRRASREELSSESGFSFEAEGKVNLDYMARLRTKIFRAWVYPPSAIAAGHQGTVRITFVVDESGRLLGVGILDSSGHRDLDRAAVQAVKDADPFGPFTPDIRKKTLKIKGRLRYVLD